MRLSLQQKEQFFHEMGELLRSGLSLAPALDVLARSRNARLQQVAESLRNTPAETAAEAFRSVAAFTAIDVELVASGESSGRLADAMTFLAEYYGRLARLRSRLILATLYPAFLLHFGALVLALPALVADGAAAFGGQVLVFLGGAYALFGGAWVLFRGTAALAARSAPLDAFLQGLPLIGPARVALAGNRFCLVMAMLVKSSGGILGGMTRAAKASGSARMLAGSEVVVRAVQAGESLGAAVAATRAFPESLERAFAVGETTGRLDAEMARLAETFAVRFEQRLQLLSGIFAKGILLAVVLALAARMVGAGLAYMATVNSLLE